MAARRTRWTTAARFPTWILLLLGAASLILLCLCCCFASSWSSGWSGVQEHARVSESCRAPASVELRDGHWVCVEPEAPRPEGSVASARPVPEPTAERDRSGDDPDVEATARAETPEEPAAESAERAAPGCDAFIEREGGGGRNEWVLRGRRGYLYSPGLDIRRRVQRTPWAVPTLVQVGPTLWETDSDRTMPHKTPVEVLEQHIGHRGWGFYVGRLVVRTDEGETLNVALESFSPVPFWMCGPTRGPRDTMHRPLSAAVLARVRSADARGLDRDGRWVTVSPRTQLYCRFGSQRGRPPMECQNARERNAAGYFFEWSDLDVTY